MSRMARWIGITLIAGFFTSLVFSSPGDTAPPPTPELKGKYEILKDERSTHQPGKVKLVEFADFYCPHCHHFDGEGLPILEKEFGEVQKTFERAGLKFFASKVEKEWRSVAFRVAA